MCPPAMLSNGVGEVGITPKGEGAPYGPLYGLESGTKAPRGNQKSLVDSSVLNVVLAMQHNMGLQQRTQIDRHVPASSHSAAEARRLAAVARFREKRKHRSFVKKVRYESRKKLAEQRPRVRGQFVKIEVSEPVERESPA